jgi:hypothetical protein
MSFELAIILVIVLSVIFSLINKVLEARRRRELEEEDLGLPPMGRRGFDLSEEDGFPEPQPFGTPTVGEEFREVKGTRHVSEPQGGREFREVSGARPVGEGYDGDEYREVDVFRPEELRPGSAEIERARVGIPAAEAGSAAEKDRDHSPEILPMALAPLRGTRRRRIDLDFKPQTVRKAIIYQEILGPPVADRMP